MSELYTHALALMSLTPIKAKGYEELAIPILNELLADCFDCNNSIRESKQLAPLAEIPELAAITDKIPYEEEIMRGVLPFGLASMLLLEDDGSRSQWLYERYEENRSAGSQGVYQTVEDVY